MAYQEEVQMIEMEKEMRMQQAASEVCYCYCSIFDGRRVLMMGLDVDAWCFFATRWTGCCSCSIIDYNIFDYTFVDEGFFGEIDGIMGGFM
jgi:hypothetical protein